MGGRFSSGRGTGIINGQNETAREVLLVYDRECPFCEFYCRLVSIRQAAGHLRIIDAREDSQIMAEINSLGLDIDQGMVLKVGTRLYYGADAIHALSLMSTRLGFFNRLNYWIFRSKRASRIFYPLLRATRNLALKLMGKSKINNLRLPDNDRF